MTTVDYVGLAATIITTIYTCFGMPVQIYKSVRRRSMGSLSLVNTVMQLLTFTSWVLYAAIKTPMDYYVIVSNAPGTICTAIIISLFAVYGREEKV